jgi:hypothetical protein
MTPIRPLILVTFNTPTLTGGFRRYFEVLKNGQSIDIEYIVITDSQSCKNATAFFNNFKETISKYTVYIKNDNRLPNIPGLKQLCSIRNLLCSSLYIARVANSQKVDLIIGQETTESLLITYLASKLCSKPWTALFQPFSDLLQPNKSTGTLNFVNSFQFVKNKPSTKRLHRLRRY